VRIEARARRLGGPPEYAFGVVCRHATSFYALQISSSGFAQIRRRTAGGWKVLRQGSFGRRVVRPANRIRADCVGGSSGGPALLTLFLNGRKLLSAREGHAVPAGAAGVIASSLRRGGVAVQFDAFTVRAV
jgi:hypothetical protein